MYRVLTVPLHYLPILPKSLLSHNVQLKSPCEKTREMELDVSRRVVGLVLGTQYKYIVSFLSVTYEKRRKYFLFSLYVKIGSRNRLCHKRGRRYPLTFRHLLDDIILRGYT